MDEVYEICMYAYGPDDSVVAHVVYVEAAGALEALESLQRMMSAIEGGALKSLSISPTRLVTSTDVERERKEAVDTFLKNSGMVNR